MTPQPHLTSLVVDVVGLVVLERHFVLHNASVHAFFLQYDCTMYNVQYVHNPSVQQDILSFKLNHSVMS